MAKETKINATPETSTAIPATAHVTEVNHDTTARLKRLWKEFTEACKAYCISANAGASEKVLRAKTQVVGAALDDYNTEVEHEWYRIWDKTAEGVVYHAIVDRDVPDIVTVRFSIGDDGYYGPSYSTKVIRARLTEIAHVFGNEKFADPEWFKFVEGLAYIHATKLNRTLVKGDADFAYKVSDAAKLFCVTDKVYSSRNFFGMLQKVFDVIIGEGVVAVETEEDDDGVPFCRAWTSITNNITHEDKKVKGGTIIGSTAKFSQLVADVMHVLMTGGNFGLQEK